MCALLLADLLPICFVLASYLLWPPLDSSLFLTLNSNFCQCFILLPFSKLPALNSWPLLKNFSLHCWYPQFHPCVEWFPTPTISIRPLLRVTLLKCKDSNQCFHFPNIPMFFFPSLYLPNFQWATTKKKKKKLHKFLIGFIIRSLS